MLKKSLLVVAMAATIATGMVSTQASAHDDPVLGAVLGAGVGAAIGHGANGRDGAVVGGALGAVAGAAIAANSRGYYDSGYYEASPYPSASTVYYGPTPQYYGAPAVLYDVQPVYVRSYEGRHVQLRYEQEHERHAVYGDANRRDPDSHGEHHR